MGSERMDVFCHGLELSGSSAFTSARSIRSTTAFISASFIPRVVRAGVPIRMPEVTKGDSSSAGIMFLFTVMSTLPRVSSAVFPVILREAFTSRSKRWLSVPPEIRR